MLRRGSEGWLFYGVQTAKDSPVANPTDLFGAVASVSVAFAPDVDIVRPLGSKGKVATVEERGFTATCDIEIPRVQSGYAKAIIRRFLRDLSATGELPWLTIDVGYPDYGIRLINCKPNTVRLSLDPEGYLTASLSFQCGYYDTGIALGGRSFPIPSDGTGFGRGFHAKEAVWSQGEIVGFDIEINNNLEPQHVIAGPATSRPATSPRVWDYMPDGDEDVTGTLTLVNQSGYSMQAGDIPYFDAYILLTSLADPAETFRIDLTNVKLTDETFAVPADGNITFESPFRALSVNIS